MLSIEVSPFQGLEGSLREKIERLEAALLQCEQLPQELYHHFAPGIYMRELRIPKDAILTGKIHRTEHLNLLTKGELWVLTDKGVEHLKAPCVIKSSPGTKRAGYALQDCIWICVHPNVDDVIDPALLEERFTAPSYEALENFK